MSQKLKLLAKTFAKDAFYATIPVGLSQYVLPLAPSPSPFTPRILERQVIFIHVPKAAGTSIKTALYGAGGGGHRRIVEYFGHDPVRARIFFKFGFVRNPWSRLLSAYSYLIQKERTTGRDRHFADTFLADKDDFTAFVQALDDPRYRRLIQCYDHFQPQTYWVCRPGEQQHSLDFLGRFETLASDLVELNDTFALGMDTGPHLRGSEHGDYRDAYTGRTRRIVEEVYARDIAAFEYEFR